VQSTLKVFLKDIKMEHVYIRKGRELGREVRE
jgi:hypothetical protein